MSLDPKNLVAISYPSATELNFDEGIFAVCALAKVRPADFITCAAADVHPANTQLFAIAAEAIRRGELP